jgi:predicted phage terminase large subunit-like protein
LPSDGARLVRPDFTAPPQQLGLLEWATHALQSSGYEPAAHHKLMLHELDALSRGDSDRLMLLMPPGSAKSTYASVLYPAWWFTQFAASSIITAAHTQGLGEYFSRRVRTLVNTEAERLGYGLIRDERSASHWRTTQGGEYMAAGVRGAITGRRADLIIIDDPIKSRAEAENGQLRENIWTWFRTDLITRLKPRGRIILSMTRWHVDDLGGRLIQQDGGRWRVIRLPALAEEDDPLGRASDEPLWPSWENATELNRKRAVMGERSWHALFQQTPRPPEGSLFRVDLFGMVDGVTKDPNLRFVRAWDLAATAATASNDPDWTVGLKLGLDTAGRYTIVDVVRMRGSAGQVEAKILETARTDGDGVWISFPQDPGQAGKFQSSYLAARLAGYKVLFFPESGSKINRALPVAAQIEVSNFSMVRANWNAALLEELAEFPIGRKDDQVDALTRAFATFPRLPATARVITLPLLDR